MKNNGIKVRQGDNLQIMRRMKSETIDLAYLDPPFNTGKKWERPLDENGKVVSFDDNFSQREVDIKWQQTLMATHPKIYKYLKAIDCITKKSTGTYLRYLTPRLIEVHRLLKGTGGLFLHCDGRASHYLKLLCDAIFGNHLFKGEVVWKRRQGGGTVARPRFWANQSDHLLFFAKTKGHAFYKVPKPHTDKVIRNSYSKKDADGRRYRLDTLSKIFYTSWAMFDFRGYPPPKNGWIVSKPKLEQLHRDGRLIYPGGKRGNIYRKVYLDESSGCQLGNIWEDITVKMQERVGYPTQKPKALLERILTGHTKEGDTVLDPFCGSGTTLQVAKEMNRKAIGIDISPDAVSLARGRV